MCSPITTVETTIWLGHPQVQLPYSLHVSPVHMPTAVRGIPELGRPWQRFAQMRRRHTLV